MRVPVVTQWGSWHIHQSKALRRFVGDAKDVLAKAALWRKTTHKIGGEIESTKREILWWSAAQPNCSDPIHWAPALTQLIQLNSSCQPAWRPQVKWRSQRWWWCLWFINEVCITDSLNRALWRRCSVLLPVPEISCYSQFPVLPANGRVCDHPQHCVPLCLFQQRKPPAICQRDR